MTKHKHHWQAINASVAGTRHRRRRQPSQDASGSRRCELGLAIAVADGAGSAPYGGGGARLAAAGALEGLSHCPEATPEQAIVQAMVHARDRIAKSAAQANAELRQYATTLTLALVQEDRLTCAQTGDGAVAWGDLAGHYELAYAPVRGEYANTTEFITGRRWQPPEAVTVAAGVARVLLTTDGMLELAMERDDAGCYRPYPPFHDALCRWLESRDPERPLATYLQLRGLLQSAKTQARTDDDVTLAIASRCRR